MEEIRALPPNGYSVVSLFSGGGGSCTGYAMAGYKVRWASEFIAEAAKTYRANHPSTILSTADIRTVQASEILLATALEVGQLDLLDGSPPCSSFSMAGKREKGWGQVHKYSDRQQRTDDLFAEAIRILRGLQPKVFLFENVSGLLRGAARGVFKEVLRELKASGYVVEARLIDASWCGVPQARQRVIFQGVRSDLGLSPAFPKPLPYRYSVADALPWIRGVGTKRGVLDPSRPAPTVQTHGNEHTFSEMTAIVAPPVEAECDISRFAIGREYDAMGGPGSQSSRYFQLVKPNLDEPCPTITATGSGGAAGVVHPLEKRKFSLAELKAICSFPPDYILTGTFAQAWERCGRSVPPLMMKRLAETVRDEVLNAANNR